MKPVHRFLAIGAALFLTFTAACGAATADPAPAPVVDAPLAPAGAKAQTLILAGGCFWGVEGVFEHTKGVLHAVTGYAGGAARTANYTDVSSGKTAHAEAARITYDPSQITPGMLLQIFFSVAHDPTQEDRQGPDVGPQYRSAIFTQDPEQEKIVKSYIAQLDEARVFSNPITTKVEPLDKFYPAEEYHQDYMQKNPTQPYIVYHDMPKLQKLRNAFPDLFRDRREDAQSK